MSIALGVSGDGSVIVGESNSASGNEAFRWTAASGMVGLGELPGGNFASTAFGVSGDGAVVVGQDSTATAFLEAFRWTQSGGMVGLGQLPDIGFWSTALAVSADGSTIVGRFALRSRSLPLDIELRYGRPWRRQRHRRQR